MGKSADTDIGTVEVTISSYPVVRRIQAGHFQWDVDEVCDDVLECARRALGAYSGHADARFRASRTSKKRGVLGRSGALTALGRCAPPHPWEVERAAESCSG